MYSGLSTRRFSLRFITGQSQPRLSSSRRNATRPIAHPHKGGGQFPICRIFLVITAIRPPARLLRVADFGTGGEPPLSRREHFDRVPGNGLAPVESHTPMLQLERKQPVASEARAV